MSDSSKQLILFDCASLKSAAKRAKVIPGDLSAEASSSNEVCEEYCGNPLDGNEEGVQMPSTSSPSYTPVVIYSSLDDESVHTGFYTDDDSSQSVHADTSIQPERSSSLTAGVGAHGLADSLSSAVASITSSTNLVCTDSSTQPLSQSLFLTEVTPPPLGLVLAHQKT